MNVPNAGMEYFTRSFQTTLVNYRSTKKFLVVRLDEAEYIHEY